MTHIATAKFVGQVCGCRAEPTSGHAALAGPRAADRSPDRASRAVPRGRRPLIRVLHTGSAVRRSSGVSEPDHFVMPMPEPLIRGARFPAGSRKGSAPGRDLVNSRRPPTVAREETSLAHIPDHRGSANRVRCRRPHYAGLGGPSQPGPGRNCQRRPGRDQRSLAPDPPHASHDASAPAPPRVASGLSLPATAPEARPRMTPLPSPSCAV